MIDQHQRGAAGPAGHYAKLFRHAWLALALALTAFAAPAFPAAPEKVMVYGDSLSAAYGIDPKAGWVNLLAQKLKPEGVSVVNASVSGETTLGGLSRLPADLKRQSPTVVVLALGANDGLRGLPVADTRRNLEAMIAASQAAGARVVLVGIQIPPNYGLDYATQFRDLFGKLARERKLPLVPFLLDGIAENLDLFQADRLHPKAEAQARILDNVLPAVRQALAARRK